MRNRSPARCCAAMFIAVISFGMAAGAYAAPEIGFRQASDSATPLTMLATESGVRIQNGAQTQSLRLADSSWMQSIERLGSDGWVATGTDGRLNGRRLLIKTDAGDLPAPGVQSGAIAWWPVPVVHRSELVGLVWLEGPRLDRLAVVASRWTGDHWSAPVVVSPTGVGSQAGLAVTALNNGAWLLTWTRFDGEDDEVVWSTGDGRRFSRPLAIAGGNSVADIQPSVLADGNGALAAWSQESGNRYVLKMARFDGRSWHLLDAPPTAAVAPQLVRRDGSALVSMWTYANGGSEWRLARVDNAALTTIDRTDGTSPRPAIAGSAQGDTRLQPVPGASR